MDVQIDVLLMPMCSLLAAHSKVYACDLNRPVPANIVVRSVQEELNLNYLETSTMSINYCVMGHNVTKSTQVRNDERNVATNHWLRHFI